MKPPTHIVLGLVIPFVLAGWLATAARSADDFTPTGSTPTGSLLIPRYGHTATLLLDGQVLGAGGVLAGNYIGSAELYDPGISILTWMPPEASVTPPAVVTLNAFAATGGKGANPTGPLAVGTDGALYGSTLSGGAYGYGTLFRLTPGGVFTNLYDFGDFNPNQACFGPLVAGPGGALYCAGALVTTESAGGYLIGNFYYPALFRLATDGSVSLDDLSSHEPRGPLSGLVSGPTGELFGLDSLLVFRLALDGTVTYLHDFSGPTGNAWGVHLMAGSDGALYGSTAQDGIQTKGSIFRLTTDGAFTLLHQFTGTEGRSPMVGMVAGPDGAMYGSTMGGGTQKKGTLFRITTSGAFTKLHDFNGTNGRYPTVAMVAGPDGALYGSTVSGGMRKKGTLFRMTTSGEFTKLHDFNGADGEGPSALVVGPDGAIYGSTPAGGSSNNGTLFRITAGGTFTKLHDFNGINGTGPGALVVGPDGALYGSTYTGGPLGGGILFKLVLPVAP